MSEWVCIFCGRKYGEGDSWNAAGYWRRYVGSAGGVYYACPCTHPADGDEVLTAQANARFVAEVERREMERSCQKQLNPPMSAKIST